MYTDAGPSRSSSYGSSHQPSNGDGGTPRQSSGRYEPEYEGERSSSYNRPHDTPNRSFSNNSSPWTRPQSRLEFRSYPNERPRARTPSPPRQAPGWDGDRARRPEIRERARSRDRDRSPERRPRQNFEPVRRNGAYIPPPPGREHIRDPPPRDRERWTPARDERRPLEEVRPPPRKSYSPVKGGYRSHDRPLNPSPPKSRPNTSHTPWNGTPRSASSPRPPFPTPRDNRDRGRSATMPDRAPFRSRSRQSSGDSGRQTQGRPGPSTAAYQASTRSSPGFTSPRPSRSVRGNSSPVEVKRVPQPSPRVVNPVILPKSEPMPSVPQIKAEVEEGELEEGEVLSSPVRPDRELPRQNDFVPSIQPRDRRREWPEDRARPRELFDRNRDRDRRRPWSPDRVPVRETPVQPQPWMMGKSVDDGWGKKKKVDEGPQLTLEEKDIRPEDDFTDQEGIERDTKMEDEDNRDQDASSKAVKEEIMTLDERADDDRPATPPLPSPIIAPLLDPPVPEETLDVERPEQPAIPNPPASVPQSTQATPATFREPALPSLETPAQPTITVQQPSTPSQPTGQLQSSSDVPDLTSSSSPVTTHKVLGLAATAPSSPTTPNLPPLISSVDPIIEVTADIPMESEDKTGTTTPPLEAPASRPPFSPLPTTGPRSPVLRQQTLAERRAVILPPTQGPLSSPFGERMPLRDPAPTNTSHQDSTDSELWPRTADVEDAQSDHSDDPEANRASRLVAAVRKSQHSEKVLDIDAIVAWNLAAAPPLSSRVDLNLSPRRREKRLRDVTWPLDKQQQLVAKLVAKQVVKEHERTLERTASLRREYQMLDEEWKEHCEFLDDLMEKRGPPPDSLYAIPNAIPAVIPGPIPTTPLPMSEDLVSSRARRRGAGDAVTTEAEFQEILAAMADTAAKDPNYRASKTTAAVPDMLPIEERRLRFEDDNDLVEDPIAFYDFTGNAEPIWTEDERQIFARRYLNFPKQFGKIAEALPNKSGSDCVLYYYRTKKEVDYKSMLASRRGVARRKAIPLKKGGKSAALLASLDQKKDTVKTAKPIPTPGRIRDDPLASIARRGGKPRMDTTARRRVVDVQIEEGDVGTEEGGSGSRDVSEAPSSKGRPRISMKGPKRPRVSSLSTMQPSTPGVSMSLEDGGTPGVGPTSDLLPPIKRARKTQSRKNTSSSAIDLVEFGPDGLPLLGSAATTPIDRPGITAGYGPAGVNGRRGNTSSYWSVEEKKKLKDLIKVHNRDFRAMAAGLPGKSERQIGNYAQTHALALGLDPGSFGEEMDVNSGYTPPFTKDEYFKPGAGGSGYARSIYDVYSQSPSAAPFGSHEPRLGIFPSLPRTAQPAIAAPATSVPRNLPSDKAQPTRSGGMRISALLNDDPLPALPEIRRDAGDAQSDGTIEDREDDLRPDSRGQVSLTQDRRMSSGIEQPRPDIDGYRRSSHGYMYQQPPTTLPAWTGQRRPSEVYSPAGQHPSLSRTPQTYYSEPTRRIPETSQQLPHRSMEYYRQRSDPYRSSLPPSDNFISYPPPSQSTSPYPPPRQQSPGREIPRYDHNHPQDWRAYRRTPEPPPQQQQNQQGQDGQGGWYDAEREKGRGVVLPSLRTMYSGSEEGQR